MMLLFVWVFAFLIMLTTPAQQMEKSSVTVFYDGVPKSAMFSRLVSSNTTNTNISSSPLLTNETFTVEIQAVSVSDDDGARAAEIRPDYVENLVSEVNALFATSGIKFYFNSQLDFDTVNNTKLNNLDTLGTGWDIANELATNKYQGKLTIFFRHGYVTDDNGIRHESWFTGNGFSFPPQSGATTKFIAMPGTEIWIDKQPTLLLHELGHYLGLNHTFPGWSDDLTDTPQKALSYIKSKNLTYDKLDGDSLPDTSFDLGARLYDNVTSKDRCDGPDSYQLEYMLGNGTSSIISVQPDKRNIMSYFACPLPDYPMHFSPMQINLMRQTLKEIRMASEGIIAKTTYLS